MFFLMYKYECLYVYQRFIMLDKGMKSILKFCQRYMEVAILTASQYQVSRDVFNETHLQKICFQN
jgi:hypothetical protein